MEKLLEVEQVETCYGKVKALKGISFSVEEGQIVALLGSNGAGKSTSLKTISGITPASSGTVRFMGQDITRLSAHKIAARGLAHIPEGRCIFKNMTIRENLLLGAFTVSSDEEKKRAMDYVFDLFPILGERRKQLAGTLSGGEQQMLAIGRGLMAHPKMVMLDELSMGLAPIIVQQLAGVIRKLNEAGLTVLLVEQNAKMALALADYSYILSTGSIVLEGKSEELRHNGDVIKAYLGGDRK